MRTVRSTGRAVLAVAAAVALAACTADAADPPPASSAPPPPASPAPPIAPVSTLPVAPPPGSTAAPAPVAWTIPAGPLAPGPLADVLGRGDCPGTPSLVEQVGVHDLTGDGAQEAVVAVACETASSPGPEAVLVLDGAAGPADPTVLDVELTDGRVGDNYVRALEFAFDGPTVVLTGDGLSPSAPLGAPDLRYEQAFTWDGSQWSVGEAVFIPA